jgi:hypothetical protein
MRRFCLGIAAVVLAFSLTGCGESEKEGPTPFKGTNSTDIDKLSDLMSQNQKKGVYTARQPEAKPADKKPGDSKAGAKK